MVVIVEGGGNSNTEQRKLREAFVKLFGTALGERPKPHVQCAGGRGQAFNDFKRMLRSGETRCLLLVDSEARVEGGSVWAHVTKRRGYEWKKPAGATEEQLHFMAETMEAWIVADPEALATHYGQGFKANELPPSPENTPKEDLLEKLEAATKAAKTKGTYTKSHGFELIAKIDPTKVRRACPKFGERFFQALESEMQRSAKQER